ncbi:MAG: hypothetical protein ACOYI8_03615 [Christensenellales bacterium]|jgi:hypothetical protein
MKKLFVLLVALLVLTTSFAYAEPVFTLADPVVTVNIGEKQVYDLTGLEMSVAVGMLGDMPAMRIDITGDGEKLMGFDANVFPDKVVFSIDGVSKTFYTQNYTFALDTESFETDFDFDFEGLMNTLMASSEMDGDTIKIPYTALNEAIETLLPEMLKNMEIPGMEADEITAMVSQLKESNSGVNIEATYKETETGVSLDASLILVENGVAGDVIFNLSFDVDGDAVKVDAGIPQLGSFYFAVQPSGEKYSVSISGEAQGMGVDLTSVASLSDAEVSFATLDAENAVSVEELSVEDDEALEGEMMAAAAKLIAFVTARLEPAA